MRICLAACCECWFSPFGCAFLTRARLLDTGLSCLSGDTIPHLSLFPPFPLQTHPVLNAAAVTLSEYSLRLCQPSTQLLLLWIYSSSTLAGEILSLPGFTHHSHLPSHIFLGLHSPPCWSAVSYQYNLTVNEKKPYSSRAKKKEKNLIANFHLLPKSDNCVVSFPYPALPFLPLCLTPHSQ